MNAPFVVSQRVTVFPTVFTEAQLTGKCDNKENESPHGLVLTIAHSDSLHWGAMRGRCLWVRCVAAGRHRYAPGCVRSALGLTLKKTWSVKGTVWQKQTKERTVAPYCQLPQHTALETPVCEELMITILLLCLLLCKQSLENTVHQLC